MLLIEAEAKTKWCPFARVHGVHGPYNRVGTFIRECAEKERAKGDSRDAIFYEQQIADCNCIGSGCMAWRPGPRADQPIKVCKAGDVAPLAEEGGVWIRKRESSNEWGLFIRTGHCGLAGPVLP